MDKEIKQGDYVMAAKYSDADPGDPWAIGFVNDITTDRYIVGNDEVRSFRHSGYSCCVKITRELGDWLLNNAKTLESSPPGSINLFKMIDTEINKESLV